MGIDINHTLLIAFLKSIQWIFVNLWYWGILFVILIVIKIYLVKKLKIYSIDDLVFRFLQYFQKDFVAQEKYLSGDDFPKSFAWISKEEFIFGELGSISFRKGENTNRDVFELLAEAKGDFVRVQKIANLMNKTSNEVRVYMNVLSSRLQKDADLAPYVDVVSFGEGAYRLAIKESILDQL